MSDDAVSRQAVISALSLCDLTPDGGIDANDALEIIEQLPPAQPEIVRCGDCKYADEYWNCKYVTWWNSKDDYCSRAERREDGQTQI